MADALSGGVSATNILSDAFKDGLSSLFSGGISALLNNASSSKAAKRAFQYSLALQNHQNSFSEYMSNTAHQREVRDLLSAGLNPILSVNSGASTPSAGSATQSPVDPRLGEAVQTALDYKRYQLERQQNNSIINKNQADTNNAVELERQYRLNNDLLEKYGDDKWNAEISQIENNIKNNNLTTAKQLRVMDAQIQNLLSGSWRNYHQALGYSESSSDSYDESPLNFSVGGNLKLPGKFGKYAPAGGFNISGPGFVKKNSHSHSYSRSW